MAKVIHFEIPVDDPDRASGFYRDALGWDVADAFGGGGYWLVRAGTPEEPGADGALIGRGDIHRTPVLVVGVGSLDDTLGRVEAGGGRVLQGRQPVPGVGWAAYVADTEGNTIGLFQEDPAAV
jgi:predicted enzyme related to lactoylglutathione lyase